jgi:hypothetical protein
MVNRLTKGLQILAAGLLASLAATGFDGPALG